MTSSSVSNLSKLQIDSIVWDVAVAVNPRIQSTPSCPFKTSLTWKYEGLSSE